MTESIVIGALVGWALGWTTILLWTFLRSTFDWFRYHRPSNIIEPTTHDIGILPGGYIIHHSICEVSKEPPKQPDLREQISDILLDGVVAVDNKGALIPHSACVDRLVALIQSERQAAAIEGELKAWQFVAKTAEFEVPIHDLDSGETSYDVSYIPPKWFVDDKIAELEAALNQDGGSDE